MWEQGRRLYSRANTIVALTDPKKGARGATAFIIEKDTPGFSFGKFLQAHPDCHGQLVDLLMGNVFRRPVDRLLAALKKELTGDSMPVETAS